MPEVDLLRENRITHKLRIANLGSPDLYAKCHELPIATQSIDLVLLPHVLEFAEEPHAVLREVDRVMMPEGRLVIVGFNPWSLWGMRSALGLRRKWRSEHGGESARLAPANWPARSRIPQPRLGLLYCQSYCQRPDMRQY